jgi:hypothetical protein
VLCCEFEFALWLEIGISRQRLCHHDLSSCVYSAASAWPDRACASALPHLLPSVCTLSCCHAAINTSSSAPTSPHSSDRRPPYKAPTVQESLGRCLDHPTSRTLPHNIVTATHNPPSPQGLAYTLSPFFSHLTILSYAAAPPCYFSISLLPL